MKKEATLNDMYIKAVTALKALSELSQMIKANEQSAVEDNSLCEMNNMPDCLLQELRFISDDLQKYTWEFQNIRDYGIPN